MTCAIRAVIRVDVDAAISTIIIAVSIVGLVITETVSNNRGNKPSNTIFLMMTSAIRTVIRVDVNAALSFIKVAVNMVNLIIAEPVFKQCDISRTI